MTKSQDRKDRQYASRIQKSLEGVRKESRNKALTIRSLEAQLDKLEKEVRALKDKQERIVEIIKT